MRMLLARMMLAAGAFYASPALADDASANVGVSVLQPTTLTSLLDLNFGTIATNGNGGVIHLIGTNGTRVCAGGMVCSGSFEFAVLSITGNASSTVQVTFNPVSQLTGPGAPMTVILQFPGGSGAVIPLTGGAATVTFGADLYVNTNQAQGIYSGQFTVNVNYQ